MHILYSIAIYVKTSLIVELNISSYLSLSICSIICVIKNIVANLTLKFTTIFLYNHESNKLLFNFYL